MKSIDVINYENYEAYKKAVVAGNQEEQHRYFVELPMDLRNGALEFLKAHNFTKESNLAAQHRSERTEINLRNKMGGINPKNIN